ncbi:MAG: hypothetical protein E7661_06945 [Ruminococcaceae bacterium]|nr:hypothetical protein [Oscillospiraceae bacterium]
MKNVVKTYSVGGQGCQSALPAALSASLWMILLAPGGIWLTLRKKHTLNKKEKLSSQQFPGKVHT